LAALRWIAAADTQQGQRSNNEDFFLLDPGNALFLLADGMGGHQAGEVASSMAAQEIQKAWATMNRGNAPGSEESRKESIAATLFQVNQTIRDAAESEGQLKMGTTIVLLGRMGAHWFVANMGDSEVWLLRKGRAQTLLRQHTMAQELVRQKAMTARDAAHSPLRHRLYRYLGTHDLNNPSDLREDIKRFDPQPGDHLLLGSDGLADHIRKEQALQIVEEEADLESAAKQLTSLAIKQGSPDNVTCVLIRFFRV